MELTIEKSIEEKIESLITQSLEKNIESILDTKLDSYLGKKLGFSPDKILEKKLGETIGQHNEHVAKEWLNVQETCDYIGISYKSLQKLINQGLKGNSIGRSKRFSKTEINHFLKNVQA
ncbi:helix-turn-helix domain-containing protein [Solibacillus sp. A46]|uniref:Helix-turn-helix domain-containing protein n=1 Tax=Solibacillus faecavium TaxID=2762221 RepID=A0ABR8XXL2_9BACL|nr:helix-turn-helix domain-containing protein [Solibacillus faecavium]MBD8036638.1 helix-turn-helix domain-containing protein [Solibacillus faecavium]